jgi:hypothetical protein
MAFTLPAFKSRLDPRTTLFSWVVGLVFASFLWFFHGAASAQSPVIDLSQLRVERVDDSLVLSANIPLTLPASVEEALSKGIPLFFVAEVEIGRERWYWADLRLAQASRTWRLVYQPLTRRWRLTVSSKDAALTQNFETQADALAAVSRIARWRIAEGEGALDARNQITFRFRLDTSQLPRPFQIGLLGQSEWNMSASRTVRISP